jgi:predicted RNA-binding protein with TRAM domain
MERSFGRPTPPVQVGEELDVKIEAVGEKGDGIAKKDGFVLFIPGVKEGDEVRVKVTKVLRKVGFAEVVGEGAPAAPSEGEPAEEAPAEEAAEEPAAEEPAESPEDTESFGEEEAKEEAPEADMPEIPEGEEEAPAEEETPAEEEEPAEEEKKE